MKTYRILATLTAVAGLSLAGCDKKPETGGGGTSGSGGAAPSQEDAIAKFKTAVEAAVKWQNEAQKNLKPNDMTAGMAMMGEMVDKMQGVPTSGLPADLKSAWGDFTGVLGELKTVVGSMPKVDQSNPEAAMKAIGDFLPKMMELQTKVEPIVKKLSEVGKKYGLDDLEKVDPGGGEPEIQEIAPEPPAPQQ